MNGKKWGFLVHLLVKKLLGLHLFGAGYIKISKKLILLHYINYSEWTKVEQKVEDITADFKKKEKISWQNIEEQW